MREWQGKEWGGYGNPVEEGRVVRRRNHNSEGREGEGVGRLRKPSRGGQGGEEEESE